MKKIFFLIALALFLNSCNHKSKDEKDIEKTVVNIRITRFDKLFFESKPSNLTKLKLEFPYFFPAGNPDTVWTNKMTNPLWQELYKEVQKKYPNTDKLQSDIENVVQHIKYYYPKSQNPKVITLISEMDYNFKTIYADSIILVPLELYLGKDHRFYQNEFPDYIKQNFEPQRIPADLVENFAIQKIAPPSNKDLLSYMIYAGKILYMKDKFLPNMTDEDKMGYKKEQITWCLENENYIWRFFIDNNLLYDTDPKLAPRFVNPAPFSKFYLEIDNESPGSVGAWIGWQIVRSYMENNDTKLTDVMAMDAKAIFEKSKYKPKK